MCADPAGPPRVMLSLSDTKTVLVVEDEILLRFALAEDLRNAGFHVIEAATGDEALSILHSGAPVDVMVSDVRMPGTLDGLALARTVRERFPSAKIISMSGHHLPRAEAEHALDGFFEKPFPHEKLIAHIKLILKMEPE
jgi:DNA-binding NtrC family response regulator